MGRSGIDFGFATPPDAQRILSRSGIRENSAVVGLRIVGIHVTVAEKLHEFCYGEKQEDSQSPL